VRELRLPASEADHFRIVAVRVDLGTLPHRVRRSAERKPSPSGWAAGPVGGSTRGLLDRESGGGRDDGWSARADGVDDLARIDPVQICGRGTKVDVAELALDDVDRHALARELDRVRVPQPVGRKPTSHASPGSELP
jgi:hypothetical protein